LELWKTVLFADASKYNTLGSDGHNYVWRKLREELKKNNRLAVKHGGNSVLVCKAWQLQ
jgi:hypothetical protein